MDGDDRRPPPEEDFTDGADVVPFPGGGHPSLGESDRRGGDDHRAPGAGRTEAWDRSEPAGSEEDPPAGTSPGPFDFDPVQPDADPTRDEPEGADDSLDELTHEHYVAATTEEYKGLARSVAEAAKQQHEQQAVAASMPGVGTGLVGFEDVIGRPVAEEEQRGPSDLPVRVLTAVVLVALLVTALWAGGWWFVGLLVVLGSVAVGEFYAVLRRRGFVPMSLLGLLGLAGIMVAGRIGGPAAIGGAVAGLRWSCCCSIRSSPGVTRSRTPLSPCWGRYGWGCWHLPSRSSAPTGRSL